MKQTKKSTDAAQKRACDGYQNNGMYMVVNEVFVLCIWRRFDVYLWFVYNLKHGLSSVMAMNYIAVHMISPQADGGVEVTTLSCVE